MELLVCSFFEIIFVSIEIYDFQFYRLNKLSMYYIVLILNVRKQIKRLKIDIHIYGNPYVVHTRSYRSNYKKKYISKAVDISMSYINI